MVETLNTNQAMVNLTLSLYFVAYAIGLLFLGPLSEKFGRKPILMFGLVIYVLGSLFCALSNSVEMLIFVRLIQAFGGSAVTVVAKTIVKDLYDGREREKIMATIMSLVIIAPMIAPILGAFLLKIGSWHLMFVALTTFGVISAIFALFHKETLPSKFTGSILRSWGRDEQSRLRVFISYFYYTANGVNVFFSRRLLYLYRFFWFVRANIWLCFCL